MAGFTSLSDYIASAGDVYGDVRRVFVQKVPPNGNSIESRYHSAWRGTGFGGVDGNAGSSPNAGTGNATTYDSSSTGAIYVSNPSTDKTLYLFGATASLMDVSGANRSTAIGGSILLVDRLAAGTLLATSTGTQDFSPDIDAWQSGSGRLASGEYAQVVIENIGNTTSSQSAVWNVSYTDQDGSASTAPAFTTGAALYNNIDGCLQTNTFLPLASGDKGVRAVTSVSIDSTNLVTGSLEITLIKPLASIPLYANGAFPTQTEYFFDLKAPVAIHSSACLALYVVQNTSGFEGVTLELFVGEK